MDSARSDLPARTGSTVGIRVAAQPGQLMMLRALTETLALVAGFPIDGAVDIRLAVDEAATALVLDATPATSIDCVVDYDDTHVFVQVSGLCASRNVVERARLGWHVLRTLTTSVTFDRADYDPARGGYPITVRFLWSRIRTGGPNGSEGRRPH
ncbi:hypothetical protein [Nocardia puris]|uniref:Serine/threonine-protein kinase RsbW n=1 Tax=Nocardia puris TaxID=208602 RepID=A0A366DY89_9NOCA|nr:hypothetical protein [Nocardia puris]RBO94489.1 serine/threonine-protein kinase RsbW [Nocardia puris]